MLLLPRPTLKSSKMFSRSEEASASMSRRLEHLQILLMPALFVTIFSPLSQYLTMVLVGSQPSRLQHARSNNGNTMHVIRRVLRFRFHSPRRLRTLRTRFTYLHTFHLSHSKIRRRSSSSSIGGCRFLDSFARRIANQSLRGEDVGSRQ